MKDAIIEMLDNIKVFQPSDETAEEIMQFFSDLIAKAHSADFGGRQTISFLEECGFDAEQIKESMSNL